MPPSETASGPVPRPVAVITTHLAPAKGFGGIAECVARLAHAWAAAGRPFSLCACDASLGRPLRRADLGLPDAVPVHLYTAGWRPRLGLGPGGVAAVWRACRRAPVVYVNGLGTFPTSLALLFALLLRRRLVVAPHAGLMPAHVAIIRARKPLKWLYYRLFVLPALRRAAVLHLSSPLETQGVADLVPGVPQVVVPNGLDLAQWPPLPPRPQGEEGPGNALVLCYLGRLSPEKGILRFLRLWARVRRPGDRLLLAGGSGCAGPYADAVRVEAAALGPDAVRVDGYLDRAGVRGVLAESDMLVLPSGIEDGDLRENFGNVVAEAMASARPVLVARGLAWDHVEAEGLGVVFAGDRDEDILGAIARARALPPAARTAMGTAGRRHAEACFDLHATAATLWAVVGGAVAGGAVAGDAS